MTINNYDEGKQENYSSKLTRAGVGNYIVNSQVFNVPKPIPFEPHTGIGNVDAGFNSLLFKLLHTHSKTP